MFQATEKKGIYLVNGASTDLDLIQRIGESKPKDLVYVQFSTDGKILGVIAKKGGGFVTRAPRSANAAKKAALAVTDPKAALAQLAQQHEAMKASLLEGIAAEIRDAEAKVDALRARYAEAQRLIHSEEESDDLETDESDESESAAA